MTVQSFKTISRFVKESFKIKETALKFDDFSSIIKTRAGCKYLAALNCSISAALFFYSPRSANVFYGPQLLSPQNLPRQPVL